LTGWGGGVESTKTTMNELLADRTMAATITTQWPVGCGGGVENPLAGTPKNPFGGPAAAGCHGSPGAAPHPLTPRADRGGAVPGGPTGAGGPPQPALRGAP
jgi:hypothetical protein